MIMGINDVLRLARTPEERADILARFRKDQDKLHPEHIDTSDIPEATDFSRFRPLKPYLDKMREHNLRVQAERAERAKLEEAILTK